MFLLIEPLGDSFGIGIVGHRETMGQLDAKGDEKCQLDGLKRDGKITMIAANKT